MSIIHYEIINLKRPEQCIGNTTVSTDDTNIQRRGLYEIDEQEASQYVSTLLGNVIQQ